MLVGSGLSLAALAMHTSDPKFRKSLTDGFTKGQFDADFWKSSVTLMGDTVGVVPGVAAVASGAKAYTAAARAAMAAAPEGSAVAGLAPGATAFRQSAWSTSEDLRQLDSPLTGWAMRSSTQEARDRVGVAAAGTGALTAVGDYASDDESLEQGSTAVDGTRGVLDDAPSAIRKSGHVWSVLRP